MTRPRHLRPTRAGDLENCDDTRLLEMVRVLPREDSMRELACEVLVTRYQSLVRSCVQPFRNSPESLEELMQVGYVGLLKAINNFDPAIGHTLAGYAQPCVSGEIKRHFRDKRWHVRVKRSLQELRLELRNTASELTNELGRMPTDAELAARVGVTEDEVVEARRADLAFRASSLDSPAAGDTGSATMGELLGGDDPRLEHLLDMQAVWTHWGDLPERLQQILLMRFYGNMTQAEIGSELHISQMHVSRLLADALGFLRERIAGPFRPVPGQRRAR
ncbi:MAG TPA: sigma-70 family RNA polymerase sigma factor [Streptosporangiaceae bacterium]|nr:sigma-70 family RNA polymerase sigma factor [Streptosporangiaceae bacterium]